MAEIDTLARLAARNASLEIEVERLKIEVERLARLQRTPSATYGCDRCGRWDGLDTSLPHDVWDQIKVTRDGGEWQILCLWCIDEIAFGLGLCDVVARLYFVGRAVFGDLYSPHARGARSSAKSRTRAGV